MKKLLVFTLVLGIASLASAALSISAPVEAVPGSTFDVIVGGLVADQPYTGGVYGDISADSTVVLQAAGNLGFASDFTAAYGGWDLGADDLEDNNPDNNPADGDWFILTYTMGEQDVVLGLYDYAVDFYTPVQEVTIAAVPEPATLALLGLGALVLRRKK